MLGVGNESVHYARKGQARQIGEVLGIHRAHNVAAVITVQLCNAFACGAWDQEPRVLSAYDVMRQLWKGDSHVLILRRDPPWHAVPFSRQKTLSLQIPFLGIG